MEYTAKELESEKWKPIFGYDGVYEVSDLGRVRSRKRGEWKIMKGSPNQYGYLQVMLSKYGKKKNVCVHRLVADAFVENYNLFNTEVNHINEIKTDNMASNLEWCDRSYNVAYNGLQQRRYHPKHKIDKLKDLYDPNLTYEQNIEIFRAHGVDCCVRTVYEVRQDLGLTRKNKPYKYTKKPIK